MGRAPCCDKAKVKKGPWSPEEDIKLKEYIQKYGNGGNWIALPQKAGLRRCGKSCRLRWLNYLRPNIKHGEFSDDEDKIICTLFASIGSRWSIIAGQLPGRTDNDIKNYWNTKLKKKLMALIAPTYTPSSSSQKQSTLPPLSLFQSNISPLLSPPYSMYSSSRSFSTGCETMSIPSSPISFLNKSCYSSNAPILESQDGYVGPRQNYDQVQKGSSCSSNSDGNSTNDHQNHQISHRKLEVDFDQYDVLCGDHSIENMQSFSNYKGVDGNSEKADGFYGETAAAASLDYSLEEIKKLISTNLCNSSTNLTSFFVEENKREEEKVIFCYY